MCGLFGIASAQDAANPYILKALHLLEYRGYDSAGLALLNNNKIDLHKAVGSVENLIKITPDEHHTTGIGHTRWATHGAVNFENTHPHSNGDIAIVHNGIIENYKELKKLIPHVTFTSETDSEVILHLLQKFVDEEKSLQLAMQKLSKQLQGTFAIAAICIDQPNTIFSMRKGSPLVVGRGKNMNMVASDALALSQWAESICYVEEHDLVMINEKNIYIFDADNKPITRPFVDSSITEHEVSKGGYEHYMLKEINEHQQAIEKTTAYMQKAPYELPKKTKRVAIVACGTSYYAGMFAKYWFEMMQGISVDVEIASEFRYRKPVFSSYNLLIVISQSGETIDTLEALKLAKENKIPTLAIVNVLESSIARMADHVLQTQAGREIGVASTKALTAQMSVLLGLIYKNDLTFSENINKTLAIDIRKQAHNLMTSTNILYIGRGIHFPTALEGALKMKELSYIHAEAYPAGELKHGPLALIDEKMPVIAIAPYDEWFEKTYSNIQEIKARKGKMLIITDSTGKKHMDDNENVLVLPDSNLKTSPFLYVIILQKLAYWVALYKGRNVDKPRNLAKSVTVE